MIEVTILNASVWRGESLLLLRTYLNQLKQSDLNLQYTATVSAAPSTVVFLPDRPQL